MSERREADPLAATAMEGAEPRATPALDTTLASGEDLPPITGLVAGDRIGRFEILQLLGAGGMGAVFAARDTELRRNVAIKVLRRARPGTQGAAMGARLLREAQAAAQLSHRNVVTVYEVGTIDQGAGAGQVFVAMELIEGGTLASWYDRKPTWREAVRVYLGAARGLAAAHAAGLVHRDFKPDNALLGVDGEVKVMDFGLASVAGERVREPTSPPTPIPTPRPLDREPTRLTSTGDIMGTPLFMAPEQRDSRAVDARADQYAFCVALFHAVARCYPFGLDTEAAIARRARAHEIATPKRKGAPRALYRILHRGLSPDPAARFPDMPALIRALERVIGRRRRAVIAGTIAATTITVAAVAVLAGRRSAAVEPCTGAAAELAATWNPEVSARLGEAVRATGLPDIDPVWTRATHKFDQWGEGWIAARTSTCHATRVDRSQSEDLLDRRMACLDGQRQLLVGTLALLEHPDRETASRAAEFAVKLPRPEECANASATSADPARVDALRATLRELQLAETAGKTTTELERAEAALADARALEDRGLEAEAGLQLARFLRIAGKDNALTTSFEAASSAEAAQRWDLATRAWSEWIFEAAVSGIDADQVRRQIEQAEAALHRAGDDPLLTAQLRNNEGVFYYQQENDAEAERLFREALSLREAALGTDDPRIAEVLDNLGNVLASEANSAQTPEERDRLTEASLAAGRRALEMRERGIGKLHPVYARSLHNVGSTLVDAGQLEEGHELLARALALKELVFGPDHPDLGTTLIELAKCEERRGNLEASVELSQRAVALWRKTPAKGIGYILSKTAARLLALGRFEEAIEAFDEVAAAASSELKAVAWRRYAAEARIEAGQAEAALTELQALVAIEAEGYSLGDVRRAPTLLSLAWAEVSAGRSRDAQASLDRALKLGVLERKDDDDDGTNRAIATMLRAEILFAEGQKAKARTLAREAAACPYERCKLDAYMLKRRAAKLGVTP